MSVESISQADMLSKYGLTDRIPVSRADIAEAALRWFRASQDWQKKSARHEPACYDQVGKLLGELVEVCRCHEAKALDLSTKAESPRTPGARPPVNTIPSMDEPQPEKPARLDDWQPYL